MKNPFILLSAGLFLAICGHSSAVVLVSDSFDDGGRTDGVDPQDSGWFKNASGDSLSVVSDGGNNRLSYVTATTFDGMGMQFSSTSLAGVGDSISVSFSFRFNATPSAQAGGIRFGLYGTAETLVDTATRTDPNSGNGATGYYANISSGSTSNSFLRRENSGTDGYTAGADFVAVGTANTTTNPGLDDTDLHTASLTITRTSTGVSIATVVDNVTLATGTNTSPYLTYNTFAVGNGALTGTVFLDDVIVQYTPVPEPATAALSLLGLAGMLVRRRR